jgi:hypothetical protein
MDFGHISESLQAALMRSEIGMDVLKNGADVDGEKGINARFPAGGGNRAETGNGGVDSDYRRAWLVQKINEKRPATEAAGKGGTGIEAVGHGRKLPLALVKCDRSLQVRLNPPKGRQSSAAKARPCLRLVWSQ